MHTYYNTKTGASFQSDSICAGGDWVRLKPATQESKALEEKKKASKSRKR